MGLSIHYKGRFNENASLSALINEVKDIAEACNWDYHIFETAFPGNEDPKDSFDGNLYGICLLPPECEPVCISFLSNKRMSAIINLNAFGESKNPKEQEYLYTVSVKTQFAGMEIHKFIVELLRYLNKKGYFDNFEMSDEGKYWETGDEKLLEKMFSIYDNLLDSVALAIESIPKEQGESFENYFARLMEIIHKKNQNLSAGKTGNEK